MADLFSYGPRSFRQFLKENHVPILYTVIIHLLIAIALVFIKVEGLKEDRELGVMLDFTEEPDLEEMMNEEDTELPAEWIQQVYEAREQASNRAVNLNDQVNQEISTEDYVNQLLNELESQKDQDFIKDREKWKEIISSYVYEDETPEDERLNNGQDEEPFTGPTTITYEFLSPPQDRQKRYLTVPVYRCEGSAHVVVDIEVLKDGSVGSAKVISVESDRDPACFTKAAQKAALSSQFSSDNNAPEKHPARITYQFIAQ